MLIVDLNKIKKQREALTDKQTAAEKRYTDQLGTNIHQLRFPLIK